jgi:predicted ATPase
LADASGIHYWDAELHRRKGVLLLAIAADNADKAESCYAKALEISREQGTKSLELRSAISLGHLLRGQGRSEEARRLLSGTLSQFTEGAATPDLKEAMDLLEHLK